MIKIKKVKCNSCNTEFDSIFQEHLDYTYNQANNCASDVRFDKNEIHCYYGSMYDFNVYEFINGEVPDWIETGVICDVCVKTLIDAGQVRLKRVKTL